MTIVGRRLTLVLALCLGLSGTHAVMAIEEPAYEVISSTETYELRRYEPYLVAETQVEGDMASSGRKAFRILADYIFGNNSASRKMEMTAPVEARSTSGTKMAMTAPVESRPADSEGDTFVYGFVMEDKYTLDSLPMPNNPDISIRKVEDRTVAVHRYSGRWTQAKYDKRERKLLDALARDGIRIAGTPMLARFNGPLTPWFLRRNEIQVPVDLSEDGDSP